MPNLAAAADLKDDRERTCMKGFVEQGGKRGTLGVPKSGDGFGVDFFDAEIDVRRSAVLEHGIIRMSFADADQVEHGEGVEAFEPSIAESGIDAFIAPAAFMRAAARIGM